MWHFIVPCPITMVLYHLMDLAGKLGNKGEGKATDIETLICIP